MSGSLGVIAVVLLETAAGGAVVLWASGVYGAVRRGFFLLTGITLTACAWGAWATTNAAVEQARLTGDSGMLTGVEGGRLLLSLGAFAGLLAAWPLLLLVRDGALARGVGLLGAVTGVVALVLFGIARGGDPLFGVVELLLGALFLGSTLHGLLLGHWYLVERRLPKEHMVASSWWYIAGVVASAVAVALSARNPPPDVTVASPLLAVPGFSLLLGGGLVTICALIAGFVWKLAQEGGRSIQAATGYFYLAVIMAFSAELAAKFRFF